MTIDVIKKSKLVQSVSVIPQSDFINKLSIFSECNAFI